MPALLGMNGTAIWLAAIYRRQPPTRGNVNAPAAIKAIEIAPYAPGRLHAVTPGSVPLRNPREQLSRRDSRWDGCYLPT